MRGQIKFSRWKGLAALASPLTRHLISRLAVVDGDGMSTLIFMILSFFWFFSQPQYVWQGLSERLRESRFDVIIPQPGSPLCHMPDLSTGRLRQLALLLLISLMGRRRRKPLASHVMATAWTHNYTGHVSIGARCRVRQVQQICCEWSPLPRCRLVTSPAK